MIYPKALSGPAVAGPRAPAPTYRGVLGSARPKQAGPRTSTTASRAQNLNHEVLTPLSDCHVTHCHFLPPPVAFCESLVTMCIFEPRLGLRVLRLTRPLRMMSQARSGEVVGVPNTPQTAGSL